MTMATLLKDLRTRRDLSAKAAADALSVHPATVWAWEAGDKRPNIKTLRRLIDLYQPTPTERARLIELRVIGAEPEPEMQEAA